MYKKSCHCMQRKCCAGFVFTVVLMAAMLSGCMAAFADQPVEEDIICSVTGPSAAVTVQEFPFVVPSVTEDRTAPWIMGVRNLLVYAGDSISFLSGITATDDRDPVPAVTADITQVDLNTPGTYEVIYTATDAEGNSSSAAAAVTVLEKEEGFTDMETICAAADELLDELLWDDAAIEEQVRAIYNWARSELCYAGHSDRSDWYQSAYAMLTEGRGDCFGYYAVTKLLFERLGIPNIDVRKVRNFEEDSDHFWSLVSVDGGETYYHFDATPRWGAGDDFCLVTDAFLDAYSAGHKNSHNRDKSLYPETPA